MGWLRPWLAQTLWQFQSPNIVRTAKSPAPQAIDGENSLQLAILPGAIARHFAGKPVVASRECRLSGYSLPRRRSWGFVTTRDEPLRTSAWEATQATTLLVFQVLRRSADGGVPNIWNTGWSFVFPLIQDSVSVKRRLRTADCILRTRGKMQAECKMQTAGWE